MVTDDARATESLRCGLQAEGATVHIACTGEGGLAEAFKNAHEVIVLHLERGAYDICANLRRTGVSTPILMLAGQSTDLDEVRALDIGADAFLPKEPSRCVLLARLRALARRRPGFSQPDALRVGDVALSPVTRTCVQAGCTISLSPREFALLELFMIHPGKILSKQKILDDIWGVEFEGDRNIVEVYVSYLRKKMDKPFKRQSIQTVRGAGYRLMLTNS